MKKIIKKYLLVIFAIAGIAAFTSCNSNDDNGVQDIEIPGITIDGDIDCCSAEEALQVYQFLQTVRIIPSLSTVVDDQYNVFAYTHTGGFHVGYNDIFFVATKKKNGNYVKNFDISGFAPLMYMVKMDMYHSTPVSGGVTTVENHPEALKRGWLSFIMSGGESGSWSLSYDISILGKTGAVSGQEIEVSELPEGQAWVKSFKVDDNTFYISLANPLDWQTGANTATAYVSVKSTPATTPYALATEQFTIEIDPRMPDMGNHSSPNNTALTKQADGSYKGSINLTMTGLWRIHLTVKDSNGNVVAGGDTEKDGFSSLFWDVTI